MYERTRRVSSTFDASYCFAAVVTHDTTLYSLPTTHTTTDQNGQLTYFEGNNTWKPHFPTIDAYKVHN